MREIYVPSWLFAIMMVPWRCAMAGSASNAFLLGILAVLIQAATSLDNDTSLFWGPYKSNLYFGVRPRIPQSISAGLMWSKPHEYTQFLQNFRHTCEQNEGMAGYGWEEYDARTGGRQVIHDANNEIDVTTEFVKMPGGDHGGNWGVRISGKPREGSNPDLKSLVIFYVSLEGSGELKLDNVHDELGYLEPVVLKGETEDLGEFKVEVTNGPKTNQHPPRQHEHYDKYPMDRTRVHSWRGPEERLFSVRQFVYPEFKSRVEELYNTYDTEKFPMAWQGLQMTNNNDEGNLYAIQKTFQGSFEFDVLFNSESSPDKLTSQLMGAYTKGISQSFQQRYKDHFKAQTPFNTEEYESFSHTMFSNLLGGVGYFYGDQIVDRSRDPAYDEDEEGFWQQTEEARLKNPPTQEGPYELFTSVPSRPFFPRGFLWDEGFHLLPIADWDLKLTLEIIKSWFKTMDEDGWIPREQILGPEARSKVPEEFQTQYPHYANPPTLFLTLEAVIDKFNAKETPQDVKDTILATLTEIYPLLKRNYEWYRKTQAGDMKTYDREKAASKREAYRWRGRTPKHILTSGLDDYPRAQPPHPGELHVDLLSWIGLMARGLKHIATILKESDDIDTFNKHERDVIANLDALHWDDKNQTYCDITIDEYEESVTVCHRGYVSLFPFMTGLLAPDAPHLKSVLDLIANPEELWSPHGIRSLSKSHELYGTDENYWRSPIWVNMNYLILTNLYTVATAPKSPHAARAAQIYGGLRRNLVATVYKAWKVTGFAWEQYNPDSGAGQRTQHFTGWTSLVVKIMCMPDLSKGAKAPQHEEL